VQFSSLKPKGPARLHAFLAAFVWSVVGVLLAYFGVRWALAWNSPWVWPLLGVAGLVGAGKAVAILWRAADRIVNRIRERGDDRCLGGFLSWKTWILVLCMMGLGRLLRSGLIAREIVGFLYFAIGLALLVGSFRIWRAWAAWEATQSVPDVPQTPSIAK